MVPQEMEGSGKEPKLSDHYFSMLPILLSSLLSVWLRDLFKNKIENLWFSIFNLFFM